jgi:hypothetical protein
MVSFPGVSQLENAYRAAVAGTNAVGSSIESGVQGIPSTVGSAGSALESSGNQAIADIGGALTNSKPRGGWTNPNTSSSSSDPSGKGVVGQAQDFFNDTPTAADSVADTPEQESTQNSDKQRTADVNAALAQSLDPQKNKGPKASTPQQDVDAALAPDQAVLASLAPEFKSTMAQLAPYIGSGVDTGNALLNAADANVASVVGSTDNTVLAGLQQLPKAGAEYAKSVTTQPIIQALLGFGKYEETYAGAQPTGQSNWSAQMDEIYKYLSGSSASTDGLGSPQAAANATPSTAQSVASSSDAGGGNG